MRNIILFLIIILILNFFNFSLELPGDYLNELNKQHSSKHFKNFFYREYNTEGEQNLTPRFQEGNEYIYNYDAQVENGMLSSIDSTGNKEESKQQASTRIKSEIKMFFPSEEQGQLCMTKIKFGQMNDLKHSEGKEECCDPMEMFEPKQIPQEVRQILEHCFTFNYVNGMIVRIHFHKDDVNWSQNIKRGVLNMLQLNLRQNNVQRESEEMRGGENVMGNNKNVDQLAYGYTIPEMTVEGECQTSYTINRASRSQQCQENQQQRTPCSFNVTKSINFKKCSKIVNLTNGYQTVEQQTKRSQSPLNDNTKSRRSEEQEGTEENVYAERDLRELNHQTLDRQTVMRVMVKCGTEQKHQQHQQNNNCQLENSEIVSNYVYKNTKLESEGPYGSSLRTKTCAKLSLVTVQSNQQQQMTLSQTSDREETLLFSNEWGVHSRRFYMFGDEQFQDNNNSPYKGPKVEPATFALQNIVKAIMDTHNGIKTKHTVELNRLVDKLRMCSYEELKQIEQNAKNDMRQNTAMDIFVDSLATCGTQNCVKLLVEMISNEEVNENKAVFAINQLKNLPIPSNSILQQVKQLTQNVNVLTKPMVRQTVWLTFGALVNELCRNKRHKSMQIYQDVTNPIQEQCTDEMEEEYGKVLLDQYNQATTLYDKLMALSALGNAGIETTTQNIYQIINNKNTHYLIRVKAIDSLRRLSTQQPRTVQQILLPIYLNNLEDASVRSAALTTLLRTQPEPSIIDQIIYSMKREPNKLVKAFSYQTMKMLAESKNPTDQQMSKHVKNEIKSADFENTEFKQFKMWQMPVYCHEQREGVFFKLGAQNSQHGWFPTPSFLKMDTYLNEQLKHDSLTFYVLQGNEAYKQWSLQRNNMNTTPMNEQNNNNMKLLKKLRQGLGIKQRYYSMMYEGETTDNEEERQNNRLTVLCMRIGDVDHSCFSLNKNLDKMSSNKRNIPTAPPIMEEIYESMQRGEMPKLNRLVAKFGVGQLQNIQNNNNTFAAIFNEKEAVIPTSIGLPIKVVTSVPMVANVEWTVRLQNKGSNEESKAEINGRIMAGVSYVQRIGSWTPFLITGASSVRTLEVNLPVHAEISSSTEMSASQQSLSVKVTMPREETRLFGVHSHQYTYKAGTDPLTTSPVDREYRTIRNPRLDRNEYQMHKIIGSKNVGVPVHIYAHYHWPSSASNIVQILKMLASTENAIHFTYKPGQGTAREVELNMDIESFQPVKAYQTQMDNFFERSASSEEGTTQNDIPQYQQQYYSEQQQKMQQYLSKYQKTQKHQKHYKHSLQLAAKTHGGSQQFKASSQLQIQCNNKMDVCQVKLDAQRSKMNEEMEKWTMKGIMEMIMPTTTNQNSLEENSNEMNNQFFSFAKLNWGANNQQQINLRIIGEKAPELSNEWYKFRNWGASKFSARTGIPIEMGQINEEEQQREEDEETQNSLQNNHPLQRKTSFINLYNCRVEYSNLNAETRNVFERFIEMIKAKYFWNSNTVVINQNNNNPANGKVYSTISIDSITQRQANITLITPEQKVYFQQIEMPFKLRPFPQQQQNAQNIQSFDQLYSRNEIRNRAECSADGNTVRTFDGNRYRLPLSTNCYSVLSKDCGATTTPQFVVLMKSNGEGNNNNQKTLKILSNEMTVECQNENINGRNRCKINGRYVNENEEENTFVQYNNARKGDLTVHLNKISVRFDGYKAWIKLSGDYRNTQCGLCGHYDDNTNEENELIMANNEFTSDLAQFHRSYSLSSNSYNDDQMCNEQELNNFYEENKNKFRNNEEEEEINENRENNSVSNNEMFDGSFAYNDEENDYFPQNYETKEQMRTNGRILAPIQITKVMEMENEMCFSKQPVKHCPKGSYPNYETNKEENVFETRNVHFICLERSDLETRQLLNEYKQNLFKIDMSNYKQHSFVEEVHEPKECRKV